MALAASEEREAMLRRLLSEAEMKLESLRRSSEGEAVGGADGVEASRGLENGRGVQALRASERLLLKQQQQLHELQAQNEALRLAAELHHARELKDQGESSIEERRAKSQQRELAAAIAENEVLVGERDQLQRQVEALEAREEAREGERESFAAEVGRLQAAVQDVREATSRERLQLEVRNRPTSVLAPTEAST